MPSSASPLPASPATAPVVVLDALDRAILNQLQRGFPICPRPYAEAAHQLGTDEATLLARLQALLDQGILTRFGTLAG